ncbi:hypothetical protein FO497_15825 [Bacillus cereus ATCC 10876]|nr:MULTISPECIES: hypothetical protein [Bacillus]MDJ0284739.1 hypothetical protein [Bacillus bombysepticus]KFL81459.1 hypothetical protein DJ50_6059 [Bacillus cereus ATCC 10876]MBG9863400.1 hypothetical protein [Bacillus cereus]MDJ0298360.1 hypothetical protein [Bacillus bombysepticus]MDJ0304189.1 hypothetical protein [Bacillus bombysepticus]
MMEKFVKFLKGGFEAVIKTLKTFIDFLATPFQYLLDFLKGIFYFIEKLFQVVVAIIKLFVALFQFLGAVIAGFFKTLFLWVQPSFDGGNVSFPSASMKGFKVATDILLPTGLLTVIPAVVTCFIWYLFVKKLMDLFRGGHH